MSIMIYKNALALIHLTRSVIEDMFHAFTCKSANRQIKTHKGGLFHDRSIANAGGTEQTYQSTVI